MRDADLRGSLLCVRSRRCDEHQDRGRDDRAHDARHDDLPATSEPSVLRRQVGVRTTPGHRHRARATRDTGDMSARVAAATLLSLATAFFYALSNVLEMLEAEQVPDEYALKAGLIVRL